MFFREGKLREADAAFREVSKRYPASPYANDALERVLLLPALERNAPGGEAYREAVQAFDRGDGKLAGELLASVKASPLAEPALLLLADVQLWQGDKAAALETLEALAKDYPDSSCAAVALLRHAGLRMADDPVAARLQLQEVVRRFPDAPQAAEARILLQMLQQAHREPQP
jgi:TolA-binding protein